MAKAGNIALLGVVDSELESFCNMLDEHRPALQRAWRLGDLPEADILIIDTDSVYGHMDWLKAQNGSCTVIAYSSHPPEKAPYLALRKPVQSDQLIDLLNSIDIPGDLTPASVAVPLPKAPFAKLATPPLTREKLPIPAAVEQASFYLEEILVGKIPLLSTIELREEGLPSLTLDPRLQNYYSTANLKSLSPWCMRALTYENLQSVPEPTLTETIRKQPASPFTRLLWLSSLLRGNGQLNAALDPNAHYRLPRWPQIEREFPKHFRIATVMLKQAATLAEIAEQSGAVIAEVIDFINAYHAIGYISTEITETANLETKTRGNKFFEKLRNPFRV